MQLQSAMPGVFPVTIPGSQLNDVRQLFTEYLSELNENLCFQSFDAEVQDPLKKYGPPKGVLLLATWNGELAGCVALTPTRAEGCCEMKRLFVRQPYRRFGVGAALVKFIVQAGKDLGYQTMVLDTLDRLQPALRLYHQHGFEERTAYYDNPLPGVVFMQRQL